MVSMQLRNLPSLVLLVLTACDFTPLLECRAEKARCPAEEEVAAVVDVVETVSGEPFHGYLNEVQVSWDDTYEEHPNLHGFSYYGETVVIVSEDWADLQHTALVHELIHQVAYKRGIPDGDPSHTTPGLWRDGLEAECERLLFGGDPWQVN